MRNEFAKTTLCTHRDLGLSGVIANSFGMSIKYELQRYTFYDTTDKSMKKEKTIRLL
jgi:hypothetical protein